MNSNGAMGFLTAYIISIRHFWSSFNNDNGNDIYNGNDICKGMTFLPVSYFLYLEMKMK